MSETTYKLNPVNNSSLLHYLSHTSLPDVVESQVLMRIDKVVESYPIYNMTLTKESLNYTEAKAQGRRQPADAHWQEGLKPKPNMRRISNSDMAFLQSVTTTISERRRKPTIDLSDDF
ncbi:Afadin [Folsomia candida]|uniref:Afadin n=1 Tax=Folsomia candida TaxID=158441 RepID=A0A226E6U3_FOLCA|nr:Afadin [Folsomia candida]